MTPEAAAEKLAIIVAARTEFAEDEIYAAMAEAGIPAPVADRAYKFTQTAWGRLFLNDMGIRFADDYLCFDGEGNVIESGLLVEQPYFVAALAAGKEYFGTKGAVHLALMAAEVNSVNHMLSNGSQPENLELTPPALFLEAPTPAGMAKARVVLTERLSAGRADSEPDKKPKKKPWWRAW